MKVFYATEAVFDFLRSLDTDVRSRTERLVGMLRVYGHLLRLPHSRPLGSGLFELRLNGKHAVRLLFCYVKDDAYIVHAIMKKQGALLRSDIEYAQMVRRELIAHI